MAAASLVDQWHLPHATRHPSQRTGQVLLLPVHLTFLPGALLTLLTLGKAAADEEGANQHRGISSQPPSPSPSTSTSTSLDSSERTRNDKRSRSGPSSSTADSRDAHFYLLSSEVCLSLVFSSLVSSRLVAPSNQANKQATTPLHGRKTNVELSSVPGRGISRPWSRRGWTSWAGNTASSPGSDMPASISTPGAAV